MARPQARPNFKTADFYAAFAKTLRTAPPPTPAAAAAAAASTSTFPANNPNVSMARAAYIGSDGASSSAVTGPASVSSPRTKVDPPKSSSSSPAASPAKSVGSSSSSSPSTASASNAHLEAEVSSLRAAVQRQIEDIARHRAEAAKRAAELEEIKTAKAELERERANLYKRITVVEKKLERGTHHRDGQKRHDRSQIAIALFDFSGDTSLHQLQFKKGDKIKIKASHESGWWTGRTKDDTVGFFPVLYVSLESS